jgi:hypothetical protein
MDLGQAIKTVLRICPKEQHYYRSVRFFPGSDGGPDTVCATDGMCTFVCALPSSGLPNALLSADLLKRALAGGTAPLALTAAPYGWVTGQVGGATYQFPGIDFANYPGIPQIPQWSGRIDAEDIAHVAVAAEKAGGELDLIRFGNGFLEATDRAQFIRLEVSAAFDAVVPARLFAGWKDGMVWMGKTESTAFFARDCELRFAALQKNVFPHTEDTPDEHMGPWALLPTEAFATAIKRGAAVSRFHVVELSFAADKVTVRALIEDRSKGDKLYLAEVPVLGGVIEPEVMVLSGRVFYRILGLIKTPNVKVGYGGPLRPVRVESANWFALLWQMTI